MRFEEQLLAARSNAPPGSTPRSWRACAPSWSRWRASAGRLADRVAVLEGQEQAARTLAAALETRLAASEAARAEAEAAERPQPRGPSPEALAQARAALEEALDRAQQARAERDRDVAALEADAGDAVRGAGRQARAALEQAQERGSITANFAREAVARAERAEQETVAQTRRAEELQRAFAALELEARASGLHEQSLEARAAVDAELRAAHAAETARWEEATGGLPPAAGARSRRRSPPPGSSSAELVPRLEVAEAARQSGATRLAALEEAHQALIAERDTLRDASRTAAESEAELTAETRLRLGRPRRARGARWRRRPRPRPGARRGGADPGGGAQAEAVVGWEARVATLEAEQHHTAAALAEATEALARAEALIGEMASLRNELAESTAQAEAFRVALDESRQRSDALAVALEEARPRPTPSAPRPRPISRRRGRAWRPSRPSTAR